MHTDTEGDDELLLATSRANPTAAQWYALSDNPPTTPVMGSIGSGKSASGLDPVTKPPTASGEQ